jgi:hypothetical protein
MEIEGLTENAYISAQSCALTLSDPNPRLVEAWLPPWACLRKYKTRIKGRTKTNPRSTFSLIGAEE